MSRTSHGVPSALLTQSRFQRPKTFLLGRQFLLPHHDLTLMLQFEFSQLLLLAAELVFLQAGGLGGQFFRADIRGWSGENMRCGDVRE